MIVEYNRDYSSNDNGGWEFEVYADGRIYSIKEGSLDNVIDKLAKLHDMLEGGKISIDRVGRGIVIYDQLESMGYEVIELERVDY